MLFLNILLQSFYQTNLTIIGHGFSPGCPDWPILWFLSMSLGEISISKLWLIVSIIISSVVSLVSSFILCTRRNFLLECCSFWSAFFLTFPDNVLTSDWSFPIIPFFFALSSSYSLNLSEINWTESCKSFSCLLPLICCSRVHFSGQALWYLQLVVKTLAERFDTFVAQYEKSKL